MRFANKKRFYFGILLLLVLLFSYFIKIRVDVGLNYINTDSLLGILIFHNVFVFSFYLLVALLLIVTGIKRIRIV